MEVKIRDANINDAEKINDIYNYYVLNSTCTYQTEPETIEARIEWLKKHNDKYPVFIAEIDNEVVGWASLSPYHTRQGYKQTVENSVYIRHDHRGKGIGKILLSRLVESAKNIGYHTIIAIISGDQEASIALHSKMGFAKASYLKEIGFKFNKRLDVVHMQLMT